MIYFKVCCRRCIMEQKIQKQFDHANGSVEEKMLAPNKDWFKVDTQGLAVQMQELGTARLVAEIISNSFDEDSVTTIIVDIQKHGNIIHAKINDDGNGFLDKKEIYTLFADSRKRTDPTKRGRFNFGEKQFLSLCEDAYIKTGQWNVIFKGTKKVEKRLSKKFNGTEVFGRIRESIQTKDEILAFLDRIAVPSDKTLIVNDVKKETTPIVKTFTAKLKTPVAVSAYKPLRDQLRETEVHLYTPQDSIAFLYEKGIPITQLDDNIRWDIDVQQKVPQVTERNVVKASYLKSIYTAIAENCQDLITEDDASETWVSDALENTSEETSKALLTKRFGTDKIAVASTTDYRANERAEEAGYHLLRSGELNSDITGNLKSTGSLLYAGQAFSTTAWEFAESVDATDEMQFFAKVCKAVARDTIGKDVTVSFVTTKETEEAATYGHNAITWNVRNMGGKKAFTQPYSGSVLGILVHELAHDKVGQNNGFAHLSHEYLDEMERIAGICFYRGIDYYVKQCSV